MMCADGQTQWFVAGEIEAVVGLQEGEVQPPGGAGARQESEDDLLNEGLSLWNTLVDTKVRPMEKISGSRILHKP